MSAPQRPVVVVGYDGSLAAVAALRAAVDRAQPDGHVEIVATYEPVMPYSTYGALGFAPEAEEGNHVTVALRSEVVERVPELAEVSWHAEAVIDTPAKCLVAVADRMNADAIAIGSRGVGTLRGLLGSVAYETIHLARCPVLVTPERAVATGAP